MSNLNSTQKTNSDSVLVESLMEVLPKAMRQIRLSNRSHRGNELSLPQFRVLAHVWRRPKMNKELADDIGLSVAAMSRLVGGLSTRGLVKRVINDEDRREAYIEITREGLTLFKGIRARTSKRVEKRLKSLNDRDKEALARGLVLITEIMFEPLT